MEGIAAIVNVMFMAFVVGALIRVTNIIDMAKKNGGIENLKVTLKNKEYSKETETYGCLETLMNMIVNVCVIFAWLYINFWA